MPVIPRNLRTLRPMAICISATDTGPEKARTTLMVTLALVALLCASLPVIADDKVNEDHPQSGMIIQEFELRDFRGKTHRLSDYSDAECVVLAFVGTECPLAKLYGPRLGELSQSYASRGVQFLGINSNCQDSVTEIASYARRHKVDFPILKDLGNKLADQVDARRTPEVFVLDRDRAVRYWGRIDDQYGVGYARSEPTRFDLQIAMDEVLSGKAVSNPIQPSVGCHIGRVPEPTRNGEVTYSNQISRVFQKHCVECHRDGEIAPFALSNYDEVAGWAETIAEVLEDRRMPPWHATAGHGDFANARVMSKEERDLVFRWVEDGAPEGDPAMLPAPRRYVTGWRLSRTPDRVIEMRDRPFVVPPEGTVEYQYFVVDPGFTEDTWVTAAEVLPGNRSVVHHAIVFVRPPEGVEREGIGWLSAYVPGNARIDLPGNYARLIPAGSKLIFQLHYTPVGSPQPDLTKLGLLIADPKTIAKQVITLIALNRDFEIPPHAADFRVATMFDRFPAKSELLAVGPHMHVRGKSFRFVAHREQTPAETLLDVPNYDFNWQHVYQFKKPIPVTEDFQIECIAQFDNSANNPVNPNPAQTVRWGDQTWEEMALGYIEVAVPVASPDEVQERVRERTARLRADAEKKVQRFFKRFDTNNDRIVTTSELPETLQLFAFDEMDDDDDGMITFEEAVTVSLKSD